MKTIQHTDVFRATFLISMLFSVMPLSVQAESMVTGSYTVVSSEIDELGAVITTLDVTLENNGDSDLTSITFEPTGRLVLPQTLDSNLFALDNFHRGEAITAQWTLATAIPLDVEWMNDLELFVIATDSYGQEIVIPTFLESDPLP